MRHAPLLLIAAAALAGCAGPQFPRQSAYPFGLAEAQRAASARGAGGEAPLMVAMQCPNWEVAQITHPMDVVHGNGAPSQAIRMGCHTQAALDAMVARRSDLTDPPERMGPASAEALNRGIERHRTIGPVPLPEPQRARESF